MNDLNWFQELGFRDLPVRKIAPEGGLLLYRAWGGESSEWGSGFYSIAKPKSVLDAELRFNIADWGNRVHFVTTFRLKAGFSYLEGPVLHRLCSSVNPDMRRKAVWHDTLLLPGIQVYVEQPLFPKIERVGHFENLPTDVWVTSQIGTA